MLCCKQCGGREFEERANGNTIRSILSTAHKLSEGKKLVLYKDPRDKSMWEYPCREYMSRVGELCKDMGFLYTVRIDHIRTTGGGELRYFSSADASGTRGLHPHITEWEIIDRI